MNSKIFTSRKRVSTDQTSRDLYLELLKNCLLGYVYRDRPLATFVDNELNLKPQKFDLEIRRKGLDWPGIAQTMIGEKRLNHLQHCVEQAIAEAIPGDLMETGVWRGGATILMRAVLKAYGITDRTVWVADSFEGLPVPNIKKYPADAGMNLYMFNDKLAVSLEDVRTNFRLYGLLDKQVRFLKGWFRKTLPRCSIKSLAVLRIDGDLYESTMDVLTHLYPRVSTGGYVIIDDYDIHACMRAVDDYRRREQIDSPMTRIDEHGVFWRKASDQSSG